jgi:hypothetical protein
VGGTINSYSILVATGKTSESHRNTENPRPTGHMGKGGLEKPVSCMLRVKHMVIDMLKQFEEKYEKSSLSIQLAV